VLEELDVKLVPGFVDEKIADAIRAGIAQYRDRLAWDFGRALAKHLPLPPKISPAKTFEILPVGGDVSVSESEVHIALQFEAKFFFAQRAAATETEREQVPGAVQLTPAHSTAR
jgi:hypothetical protein